MSEFKIFNGKTVDEAMEEACRHFGAARDKMEIEILSGGSSGIFGLVGKKKAQVRAKLREEKDILQEIAAPAQREAAPRAEQNSRPPKQSRQGCCGGSKPEAEAAPQREATPKNEAKAETRVEAKAEPKPKQPSRPARAEAPKRRPENETYPDDENLNGNGYAGDDDLDAMEDDAAAQDASRRAPREERRAPETPPQPMTPELEAIVREVMGKMLDGILGQIPEFEITGHSERVSVLIFDEENSGLLIGREGQTLSSIQYLVNRIVIRRHGNPVKIQINTGEYRERQDDNLRKMAIFLADKAKTLGRPQSTKPLSSYHRRVVHLALQEDEAISTRSKGEGPLKRVLIVPRGGRGESQNNQRTQQQ
ncbi:MAG: Jag N-terminal domain-containing protein [Solidesulfovibrio sp.]